MPSFGKNGYRLNLDKKIPDIEDREFLSKYFCIKIFNPNFSAGKNLVGFDLSSFLLENSSIDIECIDSHGNSLYIEQAASSKQKFSLSAKYYVSIHVYDDIYNGPGKLIFWGLSNDKRTVRWVGNINIDKSSVNTSPVIFYDKPNIFIRPILLPVIDEKQVSVDDVLKPRLRKALAYAVVDGWVDSILLLNGGSGYISPPNVSISPPDSSTGQKEQASALAEIDSNGTVVAIHVVNPGRGYKNIPSVTLSGGNPATPASARAIVKRSIVNVVLTNGGSGYDPDFPPTVKIISISGGYGAIIDAVVGQNGEILNLLLKNGGDGYIEPPDIQIDPPWIKEQKLKESVELSGYCVSSAIVPYFGYDISNFDSNKLESDYRIILTDSNFRQFDPDHFKPTLIPKDYFNSQMEGKDIQLTVLSIRDPVTGEEKNISENKVFKIKKVLNASTLVLDRPYVMKIGSNLLVVDILKARFSIKYDHVLYNTSLDSSKKIQRGSEEIDLKRSYAEVSYSNIKTFSGRVFRHKIYRKSSFIPSDFELISDELFIPSEILSDPISFNQFHNNLGKFYNKPHISKYWYCSNESIKMDPVVFPIDSVKIYSTNSFGFGEDDYLILKTATIGQGGEDHVYRPFSDKEFDSFSGPSYNSNFIFLKKDVLYNLKLKIYNCEALNSPEIKVYFTSSIDAIKKEPKYNDGYGWLLGTMTNDLNSGKIYEKELSLFFTPAHDYYGTLVIRPLRCKSFILNNVSLKIYQDHGFSPDYYSIRIPFPVNTKDEAFDIKVELLDINSNVVYSQLNIARHFDPEGLSIDSNPSINLANMSSNSLVVDEKSHVLGINFSPKFYDIDPSEENIRILAYKLNPENQDEKYKLFYTNITKVNASPEYIQIGRINQSGGEKIYNSISVEYDLDNKKGRRIFIDEMGNRAES